MDAYLMALTRCGCTLSGLQQNRHASAAQPSLEFGTGKGEEELSLRLTNKSFDQELNLSGS